MRTAAVLVLVGVIVICKHLASQSDNFQRTPVQQWSTGFWTGQNGVPLSSLDWGALTHVSHVAVIPNIDGSLAYICSDGPCSKDQLTLEATALVNTAHAHDVKALLCVGNTSGARWTGATSPGNVIRFVNNILQIVYRYGYDGVDLDWEDKLTYPQMSVLISSLRRMLETKILTADALDNDATYWGQIQVYLDRVNAMTYDEAGNWNPYSWFNAPLYGDICNCVLSLDRMRQDMTKAGVPPAKLDLGIPFYGWISEGGGVSGPRQIALFFPSLSQMNYNQLAQRYDLSNPNWDSSAQVPWIKRRNGWITFDNAQSITAKIKYIENSGLGGWIIWALDQDYMPSHNPTHPLLEAVKNAMRPNLKDAWIGRHEPQSKQDPQSK